jgi:hypothetical protein
MIYPSGQVIKIIQNGFNWNVKRIRKVSTDGIIASPPGIAAPVRTALLP